ncbi:MAG: hypothetical protein SGPRY_003404 [Prymnesium sp.]
MPSSLHRCSTSPTRVLITAAAHDSTRTHSGCEGGPQADYASIVAGFCRYALTQLLKLAMVLPSMMRWERAWRACSQLTKVVSEQQLQQQQHEDSLRSLSRLREENRILLAENDTMTGKRERWQSEAEEARMMQRTMSHRLAKLEEERVQQTNLQADYEVKLQRLKAEKKVSVRHGPRWMDGS